MERLTVGDSALSSRACTHVSLTTEGRFDSSSLERDSRCNRLARSSNGDGEKKRKWRRRMVNGKFQYWIWWKRVNAEVKHRAILLPGPRKKERERERKNGEKAKDSKEWLTCSIESRPSGETMIFLSSNSSRLFPFISLACLLHFYKRASLENWPRLRFFSQVLHSQ